MYYGDAMTSPLGYFRQLTARRLCGQPTQPRLPLPPILRMVDCIWSLQIFAAICIAVRKLQNGETSFARCFEKSRIATHMNRFPLFGHCETKGLQITCVCVVQMVKKPFTYSFTGNRTNLRQQSSSHGNPNKQPDPLRAAWVLETMIVSLCSKQRKQSMPAFFITMSLR